MKRTAGGQSQTSSQHSLWFESRAVVVSILQLINSGRCTPLQSCELAFQELDQDANKLITRSDTNGFDGGLKKAVMEELQLANGTINFAQFAVKYCEGQVSRTPDSLVKDLLKFALPECGCKHDLGLPLLCNARTSHQLYLAPKLLPVYPFLHTRNSALLACATSIRAQNIAPKHVARWSSFLHGGQDQVKQARALKTGLTCCAGCALPNTACTRPHGACACSPCKATQLRVVELCGCVRLAYSQTAVCRT